MCISIYVSSIVSRGKDKGHQKRWAKGKSFALLLLRMSIVTDSIPFRSSPPVSSLTELLLLCVSVFSFLLFIFSRLRFVVMTLFFGALCNQMLFASMYLCVWTVNRHASSKFGRGPPLLSCGSWPGWRLIARSCHATHSSSWEISFFFFFFFSFYYWLHEVVDKRIYPRRVDRRRTPNSCKSNYWFTYMPVLNGHLW